MFRLSHFIGLAVMTSDVNVYAADWPQFLGPDRTGVTQDGSLRLPCPPSGPTRKWSYDVGAGWSGPVVSGGKVLIFHRVEDEVFLDCLDATSGRRVWRFNAPTSYRDQFRFDEGPRATPTIANGRVFAFGADGQLFAVDLTSGRKLWHRDLHADFQVPQAYFGTGGSPLVEGGKVILNLGGRGAGLVALDASNGSVAWKVSDDAASYASPVAATINGLRSVVAFTRDGLLVVDLATGVERSRQRWRARIQASVNAATPLVRGNEVFLSSSYSTGAVVWRIGEAGVTAVWRNDSSLSCHYNTPVLRDGYLFGIDGRQEGGARLRCVEWATGTVKWTQEGFGCSTLVLVGERVIAMTESGDLVTFRADATKYAETGRFPVLTNPVRAAFAVSDGVVFARDGKRLVALDLKKP